MDAAMIEVLDRAGSQDPNILKPAEHTLKQWETERGFYTALYNVFSNHSLGVNVRWIAVIYFKNGVDKYWRKNAPNAIAEDEKEFLRLNLISKFEEPVPQLALQLAAIIAKIARYDCPKEWSSLIPTILDVIQGQNSLAQHRALLTLHHVTKSLASKRLAVDIELFRNLTTNVFSFILNLWNTYTESFLILASSGADTNQIQEALEKALLLLRILRTLTTNGFNMLSKSHDAMSFLKMTFERAKACLECRKALIPRGIQMDVCDKFIIHLTKIMLSVMEEGDPSCHDELTPTCLEFSIFYCFTEDGQALAFEKFVIQCLNLMRSTVIFDFSNLTDSAFTEISEERRLQANQTPSLGCLTLETLTIICTRLVTYYFLLTPNDLDKWDKDPETFVVEDSAHSVAGDSYKYNLRPCTEALFLAIFRHYRANLAPVLVELMQRHHQPVDPNNLHAILLKDAVYKAVGLVAFDLYDEVNFDQWFSTTLKEELKIQGNNYRIIRRRVCWLIGRWTSVKLSIELRPELYKLMIQVLSPEEDLGVRLAASDALKLAIDDFQFNPEEFLPYLEPAFSLLLTLLKEVKECDTKMNVLYVLSYMIERVGSEINPHVPNLSSYLPALWQDSEEHNMLRCAIISTLVHLEKALGTESVVMEPLVVGVIALSCDVNQNCHIYLLEDGLRLWLALLENASAPTPDIMDLAKYLPALLDQSLENLKICTYIVRAYIVLSPQEFLSRRGPIIIETFRSLLPDLNPDAIGLVMTVFELCLYASPQQGVELIKPDLITIFENAYKGEERRFVLSMYLSIMARVLWFHKDIFVQVISEITRKIGNEAREDAVLGEIIRIWVNQMPYYNISSDNNKVVALALCSLLGANSPPSVFQHFPLILSNITGILHDLTRFDPAKDEYVDYVFDESSPPASEDEEYGNKHEQRLRMLRINDPLCRISLKNTLQNQLLTLRRQIGDNQFNQLMSTLDKDIEKDLKFFVSL